MVAQEFLDWLALPADGAWLDIGCGTGALSRSILQDAAPRTVIGIDRSAEYIAYLRSQIADGRARFEVGDAQALPVETSTCDAVVSGLVLNFIPQPWQAVREMARATRSGGVVAAYVWDYAGEMQLMRHFWDVAGALDPAAFALDEGRRFPICQPAPLEELFQQADLRQVAVQPIDISTHFQDFDDYWRPFLGAQGPAPGYAMSLSEERRAVLRDRLRDALPFALDGSIPLVARAWAVRGVKL
jgi:SAM-dependent methyltransferase